MNDLEIIYTALQNATVVDEKPQELEENKDRIHLGNFDPYIKEEDLESVKLTMLGTNESVFEDGDMFIDLGLPSGTI